MILPRINTLVIPPHTRLLSIERLPGDGYGSMDWAIWIETNAQELSKPHQDRQGTYLYLNSNGGVHRVTIDGMDERILRVME